MNKLLMILDLIVYGLLFLMFGVGAVLILYGVVYFSTILIMLWECRTINNPQRSHDCGKLPIWLVLLILLPFSIFPITSLVDK